MNKPERIDIALFDLENQMVKHIIHSYIELGSNYVIHSRAYHSEVPKAEDPNDHSLGWKEKFNDFYLKFKRELIVSVEYYYHEKGDYWFVETEVNGYPNSITLYFETRLEAENMCKKLEDYIFGSNE